MSSFQLFAHACPSEKGLNMHDVPRKVAVQLISANMLNVGLATITNLTNQFQKNPLTLYTNQ